MYESNANIRIKVFLSDVNKDYQIGPSQTQDYSPVNEPINGSTAEQSSKLNRDLPSIT